MHEERVGDELIAAGQGRRRVRDINPQLRRGEGGGGKHKGEKADGRERGHRSATGAGTKR